MRRIRPATGGWRAGLDCPHQASDPSSQVEAVSGRGVARYCPLCGTRLARDHADERCSACQQRFAALLARPPQVPAEFWETEQLRDAFESQHIGRVSRAYRKHPYHVAAYGKDGITQEVLGGWLGLAQAQISRIETGSPVRNLDSLCYWARTLRIPPYLLWFKLPSAHQAPNGAPAKPAAKGRPIADSVVSSKRAVQLDRGSAGYLGVVSGCLLKRVREAINLTASTLAEGLALDVATVQGWESGRRSLTALPAADLTRLRVRLIKLGAPPVVFAALDDALKADMVIAQAVEAGSTPIVQNEHLLASFVHKRDLTNVITWPLTGLLPPHLRRLNRPWATPDGPVAGQPMLSESERARFFDHLLITVDTTPRDEDALLRRQAIYLLGFDTRPESVEWLRAEQGRAWRNAHHSNHVPSWVAVRSSALALARFGDRDPLRAFVQQALTDERHEAANLNYWAYWIGEIPHVEVDDTFMITADSTSWGGAHLLRHLLNRFNPGNEHAELNIHTLWALLLARPCLFDNQPKLRSQARERIEQLADDNELSSQARQELTAVAYAIRLAER